VVGKLARIGNTAPTRNPYAKASIVFDPSPTPRVFSLPIGVDFTQQLVNGLMLRLRDQPPEALARVVIYVNTRRSARRLEGIFCANGACLLPDIRVITALAADPLIDLLPAIPALRRRLVLARLVTAFVENQPDVAPKSAVFDLAASLGQLLDTFQGEGVPLSALHKIDTGQQSAHWERSLKFLDILADYWGNHRPGSAPDPEERQRAAVEFYSKLWQENPPAHPIIVAGSTGSRGATAAFIGAVASLPQGAVVLPGYDYEMRADAWDAVTSDHPQYGFKALSDKLQFPRPPLWQECAAPSAARNRLVSLALRPAPVTDQWLTDGPKLLPDLPEACANITLIEATSPRAEAEAIAVRLRLAVEAGQKAALVSPDRNLTRRVTGALARWNIEPDDSAGHPLSLTPPGILLRRIAASIGNPMRPVDFLALVKHPLSGGKDEVRRTHLRQTRKLELEVLRGGAPFVDWPELAKWAESKAMTDWLAAVRIALEPIVNATMDRPLADWLALHRLAGETLSKGLSQDLPLWDQAAGQKARQCFEALESEAAYGDVISATQYRALFGSVLAEGEVRTEAFRPHPGIAILGTLEARVQSADLVILGGLNEGVWPAMPEPDPWMSRDMRRQIGLPLPERQTGLSAHDFQQAAGAQEIVISRAIRDGESPTIASRWLIRLENLLDGLAPIGKEALVEMRNRGAQLLAQADAVNTPEHALPPARRPSPAPPLIARPQKLSVTEIEKLIRDPYAIYAKRVLKLFPLKPLGREADALERGIALHDVLEKFIDETRDALPLDAETIFMSVARRVILANVPWPSIQHLWLARLQRSAGWFVATERERRDFALPFKREIKGVRTLSTVPFTLTAKADRLDLQAGGALAIYDYKAGTPPTEKQIRLFNKQLPLEAAIAHVGGFEGVAKTKVARMQLIGLNSGIIRSLELDDAAIEQLWQEFELLITAFHAETKGYPARARPELLDRYASDYDHLSRFGEWLDGDDTETEAVT